MNILSEQFVFSKTSFASQEELFGFAAEKLCEFGRAKNPPSLVDGLFGREKEFSTYIENGVAIPHCRSNNISESTVLVIKNNPPILWTGSEDKADLIILLAVPGENADKLHLRILGKIAQKLMDAEFIQTLKETDDPSRIYLQMESINTMEV